MKAIDRLYQYLGFKNLRPTALEKEIGLANGYIGKQKSRNSDMGEGVLLKIIDYCQDINPMWLLTGEGSMIKSDNNNMVSEPAPEYELRNNEKKVYKSDERSIPLVPISAMAGFFRGETKIMEYECEQYVIPVFRDAEFLIPVKGTSMMPLYQSGDIVACKRVPMTDLFFQWNHAYVIDTDQGVLIKRIRPGRDDRHVLIVSENADYEPFELSVDRIYGVAIVLGTIRLE